MYKILLAISLVIVLASSIYSQVDVKSGSFRVSSSGFGVGNGKLSNSHFISIGKSRGKIFSTYQSGKMSLPEEISSPILRQALPLSYAFGDSSNHQNDYQYPQSSTSQTQPHSSFLGGGLGHLTPLSIMNNFIGQALFGWISYHHGLMILPHPIGSTSTVIPIPKASNTTTNNSTNLLKEK